MGRRSKGRSGNDTPRWWENPENVAWKEKMLSLPPEDRYWAVAEHDINHKEEALLVNGDMCPNCWLRVAHCFCDKLTPINLHHRVILFMHYKGKILLCTAGEKVQRLISGLRKDEDALTELCEREKDRTIVLFPCNETSIAPEELVSRLRNSGSVLSTTPRGERKEAPTTSDPEEYPDLDNMFVSEGASKLTKDEEKLKQKILETREFLHGCEPLNLILLDGTWGQARSLLKRVPESVPRVRVEVFMQSLLNPLRKQSQPDRICTLEALMMILDAFGEDEEIYDRLEYYLKVAVDALNVQNRKKPAYNVINNGESNRARKRREQQEKGGKGAKGRETGGRSPRQSNK